MGDKQYIHYWIIDNRDIGRCRYCGAVEDFSALMRREEHKSALKTVSLTKSVAAKKRWQDEKRNIRTTGLKRTCAIGW